MRAPSLPCSWLKRIGLYCTAEYSFTGTLTVPHESHPFQMLRGLAFAATQGIIAYASVAQTLYKICCRHGPRHQEALRVVATDLTQPLGLRLGLDALGDHVQPQAVRERYDRGHDRRRVRPRAQVTDERA